ncbi:MAG: protein kinase, partial [Archaeoglobaceae archaeon]
MNLFRLYSLLGFILLIIVLLLSPFALNGILVTMVILSLLFFLSAVLLKVEEIFNIGLGIPTLISGAVIFFFAVTLQNNDMGGMSILLILAGALTYLGKSSKIRDLGNKLKLKVLDKLNFIRSSILLATVLFVLGLGAGGTPGGILILISMSFLLAIAIVKAENTTGKKFGNIALYTGITLIVASLFIEVIIPKTVSGFLVAFGVLVILSALFGILRIKTPKMAKALGKWLELSDYSKKSKVNEDEKSIPLDTLLRNYEIIEFLGEGGFAKVFKAKRKSDGKIVALKIPRIDESTSKSFISEVSAWIHLEHKNIVKLYSADIIPVPYLEMEFVQGLKTETGLYKSLDELEKPLNERLAVHFVRKIAEGLLY